MHPRTTHLLYLHGFRSSPRSFKAQHMGQAVAALPQPPVWWCPQLPPSPAQAMALLRKGIAAWPKNSMAIVGSSLGGFYAHVLARQIGCTLVLLNPAVYPARDLAGLVGEHPAWHDPTERLHFETRHIDELSILQAMPAQQTPPTLTVIAQGDEVLDWREMQATYGYDRLRLIAGGDHALSDFKAHIPEILNFLGLR